MRGVRLRVRVSSESPFRVTPAQPGPARPALRAGSLSGWQVIRLLPVPFHDQVRVSHLPAGRTRPRGRVARGQASPSPRGRRPARGQRAADGLTAGCDGPALAGALAQSEHVPNSSQRPATPPFLPSHHTSPFPRTFIPPPASPLHSLFLGPASAAASSTSLSVWPAGPGRPVLVHWQHLPEWRGDYCSFQRVVRQGPVAP